LKNETIEKELYSWRETPEGQIERIGLASLERLRKRVLKTWR
jgi:hypothetical protein